MAAPPPQAEPTEVLHSRSARFLPPPPEWIVKTQIHKFLHTHQYWAAFATLHNKVTAVSSILTTSSTELRDKYYTRRRP